MKKIFEKAGERYHAKASERYVDVKFYFEHKISDLDTSVPTEYRRTGVEIEPTDVDRYLTDVHAEVHPNKWKSWLQEQREFWAGKPRAGKTKEFFEKLAERFEWCCVRCELPVNPNWARRIQDLKEYGYTIATDTTKYCHSCSAKTTQIILLPIKRGGVTGYEGWSDQLRDRIVAVLGSYDAFEARKSKKEGLLPDHKFPEIRWDISTRRVDIEAHTDDEIRNDFQLLTNQRNLQKREVCRSCFQTGKRGTAYGIRFFFKGGNEWDPSIPRKGKAAEQGCVGCAWHDLERWRTELNRHLEE